MQVSPVLHESASHPPHTIWGGRYGILSLRYFLLLMQAVWLLKGTVPRDFLPLVFFFKLGPVDMPRNYLILFRLFAEIFDYFGASPVSTTPVSDTYCYCYCYMPRNYFILFRLFAEIFDYFGASPVSTTPAKNYSPVSLSDTGE